MSKSRRPAGAALGEGNGRTRFWLDHIARVDDERWAQFGPGAVGVGCDGGLIGLYLHLTT